MAKPKILKAILLIIVVFLPALGCGSQSISDDYTTPPMVLRLAETYSEEHPSALATQKFADLVYEQTDGHIQIKVYYNGELGNEAEVLEQLQFGGIALARVNLLALSDVVIMLQNYIKPFIYPTPDDILNTFADQDENISSFAQLEKLVPLVWYYPDIRCFYNNKTVIHDVDDFNGLKLQSSISNAMTEIISQMGSEPVNILTGDTFKSLDRGFMDGGESSFCSFLLSDVYAMVPYVSISDYLYCPDVILGSGVTSSKIKRNDQELIIKCAKETFEYQKTMLLDLQMKGLKRLEEKGAIIEDSDILDTSIREHFDATKINGVTHD